MVVIVKGSCHFNHVIEHQTDKNFKHVFPNRPEYRLNNRDPKQCFRSSPSFSNPLPGRVSVSCSLIAIANQQLKILCLKVDIIFCSRMDNFGN